MWWKLELVEQARKDAEQEREIQARREARARRRREIWAAVPDWVKMAAVGLVIGAVACIPLLIYWPR